MLQWTGMLLHQINWVFCEIDFNDAEAHAGTSYLPFIGFMASLFALVFVMVGIVKINNAKRQWNLFYDQRDRKDLSDPKYEKEKKVGIGCVIVGIALFIISIVLL